MTMFAVERVAAEGPDLGRTDRIHAEGLEVEGWISIERITLDSSMGLLEIKTADIRTIRIDKPGFHEGFEQGLDRWQASASNETRWHDSTRRAVAGERSAWCGVRGQGRYSDDAYAVLTSPEIDTRMVPRPVLSYYYSARKEDTEETDTFRVEVSSDGGRSWLQVALHPSTGQWTRHQVDLRDFRSARLRVRFLFNSDVSEAQEGVYLDEVRIGAPAGE